MSEEENRLHREIPGEIVEFKVVYKKKTFVVTFGLDETASSLKQHIQKLTDVPPAMQKLVYKGLVKDEKTLRQLGVTKGSKMMVVGSTLNEVVSVNTSSITTEDTTQEDKLSVSTKEPLCKQKLHKKIIDKGKPDDCMPGVSGMKEQLPTFPLYGMVNKMGGKVRLTFKLEFDQVWLGTKERTEKLPMNSIKNIISEPIVGYEEYHLMALQLGPTEASRYWIYWVPSQYIDAIKDAILGKWQTFD